MKKKEIEKIPFRGGVRADKQYRNTAVVFLQDIRGESHLFVEVYENKKRELQTPVDPDGVYPEGLGLVLSGCRGLVGSRSG